MQILDNLLIYSGLNVKQLSEKIGMLRPQALYDVQNGKTKNISPTMANKIISVFPEISRTWLLTGEGDMLNEKATSDKNVAVVCEDCNEENMDLSDFVAETLSSIARGVRKAQEQSSTHAIINPYINNGTIKHPHNLSQVRFHIGLIKSENVSSIDKLAVYFPQEQKTASQSTITKQLETVSSADFEVLVRLPETEVKD